MTEQVEGVGVRQHPGLEGAAVEIGACRVRELVHGRGAGARGRLIGGDGHAPDAVVLVNRPERRDGDDGRAVGIGDDALVAGDGAGIDLWDHQRYLRVHSESRGVVDHDGAGRDRDWGVALRDAATRRKQGDIDALEALLGEFLDDERLAVEGKLAAHGAGGGEQAQLLHRETPLGEAAQELHADGAGGANDGYCERSRIHVCLLR